MLDLVGFTTCACQRCKSSIRVTLFTVSNRYHGLPSLKTANSCPKVWRKERANAEAGSVL